jgi:uncharacterized membrane protein YhaH (DUF805 family)
MLTNQDYWIIGALLATNVIFFFLPITIIIRRMGFSGWWILFSLIPLIGMLGGIWMLALARWPALEKNSN